MMEHIKQNYLSGERALFKSQGLKIENSVFADGAVSYTHLDVYKRQMHG